MARDLILWPAYDFDQMPHLVFDAIHLSRESSYYVFTHLGNDAGRRIKPEPVLRPIYLEVPDPSVEGGQRRIDGIIQDPFGNLLTFVRPEAFKGLTCKSRHNELVYRLMESHDMRHAMIVILWWH